MNLNNVTLAGYLSKDPETRVGSTGSKVTKIQLAVNSFFSRNGERKTETCFISVYCFGNNAEAVEKFLKKGSPVLIAGRLKLDTWEDPKTGEKRSRHSVTAEKVEIVKPPKTERKEHEHTDRPSRQQPAQQPAKQYGLTADYDDEDIPF